MPLTHTEKIQLARVLVAESLPEIRAAHAAYPEQTFAALTLLEMLVPALDTVFLEIDAIEETNRRAEAGRRAMRTRFGVIDGYYPHRAQVLPMEQRT